MADQGLILSLEGGRTGGPILLRAPGDTGAAGDFRGAVVSVAPGSARGGALLEADQTGLPALQRFLEELPAAAPVTAVMLAPAGSAREIGSGRPARVRWLDHADPAAAVAAVEGLPPGEGAFVWGAAEAGIVRALRTERGLAAGQVEVRGNWHHGTAGPVPTER